MSSTETKPKLFDQESDVPDICHLESEVENVALCGKRLKGIPATADDDLCVVCADLAWGELPVTG